MVETRRLDRRTLLTTTAGLAVSFAGCSTSGRNSSSVPKFDGWFDGVSNYDGVTDRTGTDEVEVTVGVKGNGGHFAFAPPAVTISTGTTVRWKWTGKGSVHNVVAKNGDFQSEPLSAAGETFEHIFETAGTYKYSCTPHKSSGMRGVIVVK